MLLKEVRKSENVKQSYVEEGDGKVSTEENKVCKKRKSNEVFLHRDVFPIAGGSLTKKKIRHRENV